eukprot:1171752-Amphidinium_carterae.3
MQLVSNPSKLAYIACSLTCVFFERVVRCCNESKQTLKTLDPPQNAFPKGVSTTVLKAAGNAAKKEENVPNKVEHSKDLKVSKATK